MGGEPDRTDPTRCRICETRLLLSVGRRHGVDCCSQVPPTDAFKGESTYTTDFLKHRSTMRQAIRPDQAVQKSQQPFDDRTGYRADYIRHPQAERFQRTKEEYSPNKATLDSLTTHKRDFTPKEGHVSCRVESSFNVVVVFVVFSADRTRSMKPDQQGYRSDARFDDATTNKSDFKRWQVQPIQTHKPDEYRPKAGEMDLNTMYNSEFTPKPIGRVNAVRPADRPTISAKFDSSTTYGGDFRKWPGGRTAAIRAQSGYEPPTKPFEGMSTYQGTRTSVEVHRCFDTEWAVLGHYIPHARDPQRSFKPDGVVHRSSAPFDDSTMYRTEYTQKEVEPCPAALLE
jgi:hypothetical protein